MSDHYRYHPANALDNPEAYYEGQFNNSPRRWLVPIIGHGSLLLTRPEVHFHDAESEEDFFGQFEADIPMLGTFSHDGKTHYHDPIGAIAAAFGNKIVRQRADDLRVWVAEQYMSDPKFGPFCRRVGGVSVIRRKDYLRHGLDPSPEESGQVKQVLTGETARYLGRKRSIVKIFPPGTRGVKEVKDGVGHVLEQAGEVVVITISLVSDNMHDEDGNIPKNLRISYGPPVLSDGTQTASTYVDLITESHRIASEAAGRAA